MAELAKRGGYCGCMSHPAAVAILATDLMAYAADGKYVGQRFRSYAIICAWPGAGGSQPHDEYDEEEP